MGKLILPFCEVDDTELFPAGRKKMYLKIKYRIMAMSNQRLIQNKSTSTI